MDAADAGRTPSDAGEDAGDAAVVLPGPVTIGNTVGLAALPAIAWTGSDFAVGLLVTADSSTVTPYLQRYRPGEIAPHVGPVALRRTPAPRSSVTVAVRGDGAIAIGWLETDTSEIHGAIVAGDSTAPMAPIPNVARSRELHDALLFDEAGDWHAVVRRLDPATSTYQLHSADLGPDGRTLVGDALFTVDGDVIEIDLVRHAGRIVVAESGDGILYRFDGTAWSAWGDLNRVVETPNECAVASRPETGGWAVCSDSGFPRALYIATVDLDVGPGRRIDSWVGPDPALAAHARGVALAAVYEPVADDRTLALGTVTEDGAIGPPCLVEPEPGFGFANDPDIACGDGWCGVVWLEGIARDSATYIVRLAQFPAGDPSHLCGGP